jgi:hypothetical protein
MYKYSLVFDDAVHANLTDSISMATNRIVKDYDMLS